MRKLLIGLVSAALLAAPAYAEDLNPPPWRGEFCTTLQGWEFSTPNPTPPPDVINNPYGNPSILVIPKEGYAYYPDWEGRGGVWPLSGIIDVEIWNHPLPNPFKEIWIQITWMPQDPGEFPIIDLIDPVVAGPYVNPIHEIPLGDPWIHSTYSIVIAPNPEWEHLVIGGTIDVDELIIDTRCFPEPASLALLGLGGLAAVLRRRR